VVAHRDDAIEPGLIGALTLNRRLRGISPRVSTAAATAVVASYATFQRDDRVLRADMARNDLREAVRYTLSPRANPRAT